MHTRGFAKQKGPYCILDTSLYVAAATYSSEMRAKGGVLIPYTRVSTMLRLSPQSIGHGACFKKLNAARHKEDDSLWTAS